MKQIVTDWIKFIVVMVIFAIGMIFMIMNKISNFWVWTIYIVIWTYTEMYIAKSIHLKWWVWAIIIMGLCGIDLLIITSI